MTTGGPANSSSVLASYMYIKAFTDSRLGYAAAVATVMLVLNLILAIGLQRLFRRDPLELG
jgi:raffinose/stachyose/melibiose transport system permease protein